MAERKILIVGEISERGTEVLETALELGYQPIVVLAEGQQKPEDFESWVLTELPDDLKHLPAAMARSIDLPEAKGLRLDRRLHLRVSSHIALAESHGISNWTTLVHPTAHISPSASLGKGVFVGPLVTVSSRTVVSEHVRIGRGSSVGHDVFLGQLSRLGPSVAISGNVSIGDESMIGTGAVFLNRVEIGARCLVGAGAVVTKDFPADALLWGNPAATRH